MRVNLRDDDNAYAQSRGLHRVVIHGVSALCTSKMRCEDGLWMAVRMCCGWAVDEL